MRKAAALLVFCGLAGCARPSIDDARRSADAALQILGGPDRPFVTYQADLFDEAKQADVDLHQSPAGPGAAQVATAMAEDICGIMALRVIAPDVRVKLDHHLAALDGFAASVK